MKNQIIGILLTSTSLLGITLLFATSLLKIASGEVPLNQFASHVIKVVTYFIILVIILCIGLCLMSLSNGEKR